MKPSELHLYYAHFAEHSPGSYQFVADLIAYARTMFDNVISEITYNSVLALFDKNKMIPHSMSSPCSRILKIEPMMLYNSLNRIEVDLIGYVRTEKTRITRMKESGGGSDMFISKEFPIEMFDDEWCFAIVKKHLGWYPAIYDIVNEKGKRVFKHNNCLPCKNMNLNQMQDVEKYYPEYMARAVELFGKLNAYWGRNADEYYTTFGKEDYEAMPCEVCSFD